ncbi:two-component sensor histidine kinase [Kribbella sandramycini]|uniref:histidine kinase n=1 Tax=Kribbella sandramycini TaxID=60450 RepID=A0A7Y4P2P4_9ACTN|nr:histidine kinase [Kribbella sandramycini]MBB6571607.1 signal transduction histidine kinase [Kribbella sandramycini]NOL44253.1 two-component sensor histidine kinase [Kribbella sandramycini]
MGWAAGLAVIGTAIAVLGLVVWRKVPRNVVGLLLVWVGAVVVFVAARDVFLPSNQFFEEGAWWLVVAVALLLLFFPDGRLPSPRWRAVAVLLVVCCLVQQTVSVPLLREPAFGLMLVLVLVAAFSLVVRFRRAGGRERAQLKWLALAGLAVAVYPIVCLVEILITGESGVVATGFGIATLIGLPASVAVAMLRHDLYDVDRIVADSVTYAIVVVALLGTYAGIALTLGLFLGKESAPAAAIATAVCALVLSPLRTRLQRLVDRRLYPPRRAALAAIEDLQRRIHTEQAQPEELELSLRTALRDPTLRVGLLVPGASGFVDAAGVPVGADGGVPVLLGGVQIGLLAGASGPAVLKAVATGAASLVEVSRLRAEVASALRDVAASRSRLVQAGDRERRRLERDLHDGAQQRLVSLGMALRLAQRHLDDGSVDVNGLLDQAVAELSTAIAELRQIAHGLRPTSLDDGLHAALAAITRSLPIPVRLDIGPDELPDELAITAYFVAAEAVTNAAKYAHASSIAVRVEQAAEDVRIRVEDDGCGGATPRPGSGLSGLADRVAAIGGSLSMHSPAGRGTTIEVVLPCGS